MFSVFVWCAERGCFPKVTVISTDGRVQPSSFRVTAPPLSSLQNAALYQNIPLWRLHMTEDLQQKCVWCLSVCFSPVNTSKPVTAKPSDSWVTLCHSEPTHRWQQLGQELRPQGITLQGGQCVLVMLSSKAARADTANFPGKAISIKSMRPGKKAQNGKNCTQLSERLIEESRVSPESWKNRGSEHSQAFGNEKVKCDLDSSYPPFLVWLLFP